MCGCKQYSFSNEFETNLELINLKFLRIHFLPEIFAEATRL